MNDKETTSSRSVGMRDINALLLFAPISRIKTLRDDEGRRGFTLIELLVVVLIIGVLAAVAIPQYQKAVLKNKLASLKPLVNTMVHASEQYYLEYGEYPTQFEDLAVTLPTPLEGSTKGLFKYTWGTCAIAINSPVSNKRQDFITCSYGTGNQRIGYPVYLPPTTAFPIGPACSGEGNVAWAVCQQETGISVPFYTDQSTQTKIFSYSKKSDPRFYH